MVDFDLNYKLIETFNTLAVGLGDQFVKIYQDTSLPLEDRWNLFKKIPSICHLRMEPYIEMFDIESKYNYDICWYDDFHVDRYTTVILRSIIENIDDYCDFNKRLTTRGIDIKQFVDDWKEEVMQKRLHSFINDW